MRLSSALSTSAVAAALLLSGCAATVQRPAPAAPGAATAPAAAPLNIPAESAKRVVLSVQLAPAHPKDAGWAAFRKEWVDITQQQAQAQGFQFSAQDGEQPTGQPGTLMVVRVNDYRHVTVGQRMAFGIMTGNAFIDAKVEFRDLKTGALYGERSYNTTSSAWQGVFSAVTPKQLYAIADEVLGEIRRR